MRRSNTPISYMTVAKKFYLLFFIFISVLIVACTKIVSTDIGGDLLPPIDGVDTKEMFMDVTTVNLKDTTTKVSISDLQSLGYVNDPLFGKTNASINVQLKPAIFPFTFPVGQDSVTLDSAVLSLSYAGVWGDSTQPLSLRAYEIPFDFPLVDFKADSIYSTNHVVTPVLGDPISQGATMVSVTSLDDTLHYRNENVVNQIRIKLNTDYGNRLVHSYDTSNAYHDDSAFNNYIKGLQIIPDNVGNALMKINLLDSNTKITLYFTYKDKDTVGKIDTATRTFLCDNYRCASSNYITHDRSGTDAGKYLQATADSTDSVLFIDANPGIYARIRIPHLDTVSNKIIHRAEILMEQVPDVVTNSDVYLTAPNLFLAPYSQDSGRRFALPNDVVISNGYVANPLNYGCFPKTKTDPFTGRLISYYSFDISRYVQGIITKDDKIYDLILYAPVNDYIAYTESSLYQASIANGTGGLLNNPSCGRVRLGGGNNTNYKMKVHIVYSDVK